jgi:hypothetical protein
MNVGENPVIEHGAAFKIHPQSVANGTMGTIAANQPRDLGALFASIRVNQVASHVACVLLEVLQFYLSLDLHAQTR